MVAYTLQLYHCKLIGVKLIACPCGTVGASSGAVMDSPISPHILYNEVDLPKPVEVGRF